MPYSWAWGAIEPHFHHEMFVIHRALVWENHRRHTKELEIHGKEWWRDVQSFHPFGEEHSFEREERNDVVSDEDSEVFVRGGNDSISINSDGWTFGMKFDFAGGFGGIFDKYPHLTFGRTLRGVNTLTNQCCIRTNIVRWSKGSFNDIEKISKISILFLSIQCSHILMNFSFRIEDMSMFLFNSNDHSNCIHERYISLVNEYSFPSSDRAQTSDWPNLSIEIVLKHRHWWLFLNPSLGIRCCHRCLIQRDVSSMKNRNISEVVEDILCSINVNNHPRFSCKSFTETFEMIDKRRANVKIDDL